LFKSPISDVSSDIETTEEDRDSEINFIDLDNVHLKAEPEFDKL